MRIRLYGYTFIRVYYDVTCAFEDDDHNDRQALYIDAATIDKIIYVPKGDYASITAMGERYYITGEALREMEASDD